MKANNITERRWFMFAQVRAALLAGVLAAAQVAPAWSADGNTVGRQTTGMDLPAAIAISSPADAGDAEGTSATSVSARDIPQVSESQPTRAKDTAKGKRLEGPHSRVAIHRPGLILGIAY
jgi:hypothetical protein